ncbi:NADP-dependent oxidoreductase [Thiofilum flexile]|uniref:NADP-dependent oxidoreductase n=1 Tax=Thiofilum flexile TaxID=125627 RepID=UPI000363F593|nr:NADP-dependent oxidoreductase [Thiofilum flexile]
MQAFILERYGKQRTLLLTDIAEPEPQDDEVVIQIHAASVNVLDAKIRDGAFKFILPYRLPLVLGHDVAGVVTKLGSRVSRFKVGDEVYARVDDFHIGTFAQSIAVKEHSLAHKPANISMVEAASLPLVTLTAWQALKERAQLTKGQHIFIQAGSGGVGTVAIQLAKYLGASVATTTSSSNIDWVKQLGADVVIDYKTQDIESMLHDYDVVLHSQNEKILAKSLRVLRRGGRLISISGPPDPAFGKSSHASFFIRWILRFLSASVRSQAKKRGVEYSFLFMRAEGTQLQAITELVEAGHIKPVVDRVFPFESTNDALAYIDSGRAKGKVVIQMQ